ncbi:DJ-1/PfpI family protein [Sulfitobacter sp. JB4-11]|uniref:DJ-1/PfpI family protein n=1 Tax=Sulfitobacter rhodophyticola TaxID=3238304 RepID=UPI003516A949
MTRTIAIVIFDHAEEMDFVGPWETLGAAVQDDPDWRISLVAEHLEPIICEKGMRVFPTHTYADIPKPDVIIVPGGDGAKEQVNNPATVAWLQGAAPTCTWITSVCTGTFLLVGAGLTEGRRITTHHWFIDELREATGANVIEGIRVLRDGNLVTAGGVTSGIEMSLWLVAQIWGSKRLEYVKKYIAYETPPRTVIDV